MHPVKFIPPDQLYGELFADVQKRQIFPDSKTFVDCRAKMEPEIIKREYISKKNKPGFDLKHFVTTHFMVPKNYGAGFKPDPGKSASQHVMSLWDILTREADAGHEPGNSLIPLPNAYVVPGGRFGEIYYWDSYFTMLGLAVSGRFDMIGKMIDNFAYLIDLLGFIPNGNRTYFLTRSQPPFFSLMVQLLKESKGPQVLLNYLPQMEKEYNYWMAGHSQLHMEQIANRRVVRFDDEYIVNRHWDETDIPRQESYSEDVHLADISDRDPRELYRNIRAACESGWDFTSRWLADGKSLSTIEAIDIIPVDLNCLLYHLENTIAEAYAIKEDKRQSMKFREKAEQRRFLIREKFWDANNRVFQDYNFRQKSFTGIWSLAMVYPLFFNIANVNQATAVAEILKNKFLKKGGLIPTLKDTGQQWDAPNGWPPLQWMTVRGLLNYGFQDLAIEIGMRWVNLCEKVYNESTKFVEKYNVENTQLEAGGGEYPVQDGFGWSNGVYLQMMKTLNKL